MDKIKIASLARGALEERAAEELQKVLENIADPNTDWKKVRKVTIELALKPMDEERDRIALAIKTKSSVQPYKPISTQLFMGIDGRGNVIAEEYSKGAIPGQVEIDTDTGGFRESKILNLNKGGK